MIDIEALAHLPYETWSVHKPVVSSDRGVVASQNVEAAAVGAAILADGGNAMDAAIATALALCVAEPWMSGLGGGGYMTVYDPRENRVQVVDYGMKAAAGLDPADYPLADDGGEDDWGWPSVVGDRNVTGPMSIAVPGSAAGYGLALETFGTRPWPEVLAPAIALAERGHRVTWWTTLMVAGDARSRDRSWCVWDLGPQWGAASHVTGAGASFHLHGRACRHAPAPGRAWSRVVLWGATCGADRCGDRATGRVCPGKRS